MVEHIEFEAKTDRELLIITAQNVNSINDKVKVICDTQKELKEKDQELELQIEAIESKCEERSCESNSQNVSKKEKISIWGVLLSVIGTLAWLISEITKKSP